MNFEQRKRLAVIGLDILKEVVLDTLRQNETRGHDDLSTSDVRNEITASEYPRWYTCQDLLYELEQDGLVERDDTRHPRRWRVI